MTSKTLVTGAAGFIGFHAAKRLIERGTSVVGIDNLNDYYDVRLKKDRLALLENGANKELFRFEKIDFSDRLAVRRLFQEHRFDRVVHLGAQAGVRYSLTNPDAYISGNIVGFYNILEECRACSVEHLTFASSSSVYGASSNVPFSIRQKTDEPVSLYAATKKSNELLAFSYAKLFGVPTTGLRFFTVYGPWGRPDMAVFRFVQATTNDRPIDVYHFGKMRRDFTYIDDVVDGLVRANDLIPTDSNLSDFAEKANLATKSSSETPPLATDRLNFETEIIEKRSENSSFRESESTSSDPNVSVPFRLYNLGNCRPVELSRLVEIIERTLGKKAIRNYLPMQPGDVPETFADISESRRDLGFDPQTSVEIGIPRFVQWFRDYYR